MFLQELIDLAKKKKASDLHLSPENYLWMRCNGELHVVNEFVGDEEQIKTLIPLLNTKQQKQLQIKHHVDVGLQFENNLRLRINLFQQLHGLSVAIRIIPNSIPTLHQLPAPPVFYDFIQENHGLILVTGPTGSGKSTTLAALIAEINQQQKKHIITLEDPIEFIHPNQKCLFTQRERYTHFNDYPDALRSSLREDPDVILIGEIRDYETIQMALTAAETGHLVLGTLHTATAASSIHRIIDMFPGAQQTTAQNLLADSLIAIISQKLSINNDKREPKFEILRATHAVRQLIRDQNINQLITAMQTGVTFGMKTF